MVLDNNYSINTDGVGTTLLFTDERTREKDGKTIPYTFEDRWYFLNVSQALSKYLDLKIEPSKDAQDCLSRIDEVRNIINKIK
jgi:hypothetical protein